MKRYTCPDCQAENNTCEDCLRFILNLSNLLKKDKVLKQNYHVADWNRKAFVIPRACQECSTHPINGGDGDCDDICPLSFMKDECFDTKL